MQELLLLAEENGVVVETAQLVPPVDAFYFSEPGCNPVITIGRHVEDKRLARVILAHELGHHFTTAGDMIAQRYMCYRERLTHGRAEFLATRWATDYLLPWDKLTDAARQGVVEHWQIAEYFGVTEKLVRFRLSQM